MQEQLLLAKSIICKFFRLVNYNIKNGYGLIIMKDITRKEKKRKAAFGGFGGKYLNKGV
jgi:hypothetical protein